MKKLDLNDGITKQYLIIPLCVMFLVAIATIVFLSYIKYTESKMSSIGSNNEKEFSRCMNIVDEMFNDSKKDISQFQEYSQKLGTISTWILKPANNNLIVLASSRYPDAIGGQIPQDICNITKENYDELFRNGQYSSIVFNSNNLVDVCNFRLENNIVIGYNSQHFYKISGLDDPNFFKWYFANMKIALIIIALIFIITFGFYLFLFIRIRSDNVNLKEANDKLIEQQQSMRRNYYYDSLTGLPNANSLQADIVNMKKPKVIIMDIDDFSKMNNYFGTRICDKVLIYLADFNQKIAKKEGMNLYKAGADIFAFVEDDESFTDRYEDMVKYLIESFKGLIIDVERKDGEKQDPIEIHCTIGLALEEKNTIKKAMIALDFAKRSGRDYFCYLKNIDDTIVYAEQIKRSNLIRDAIINDNIIPHYQPIFNINKKVTKYETLMRIQDSNEIIAPGIFIGISKHIKRYVAMEKMLIKKSFKLISENKDIVLSINLSARDMTDGDVSAFVVDQINKYKIADRIIFEILEDENIENVERMMKFIERVKRMGVRIAIDDFGSGYSNFANILKLKPDYIKIDGSIIKNIDTNIDSRYIATAIVAFCKKLNIRVVAEYVHSKAVFDTCVELGIDEFQGFYLAEPSKNLFRS